MSFCLAGLIGFGIGVSVMWIARAFEVGRLEDKIILLRLQLEAARAWLPSSTNRLLENR